MSSIYQASKSEQIAMLRELTKLTGALHEVQVLQLKMWPMVLFETYSSTFSFDFKKKSISFKISCQKQPSLQDFKKRVGVLNTWVQELLGSEWMVVVDTGKKKMSGLRKINVTPEPSTGADPGPKARPTD